MAETNSINLLGSMSLVEAPFVKITIGEKDKGYTFGIFQKNKMADGTTKVTYPNYVQSLNVKKINGAVNQYTLDISYPVTQNDDPNFFEKVFSSVSDTRKIFFSYGDFSTPNYIYSEEQAIITDVSSRINIEKAVITYQVKAVSSAALTLGGNYSFRARKEKPSTVIKELLNSTIYNLKDVFTGMQDSSLVESSGMLAADDQSVNIPAKQNISILDYLSFLVSCMVPISGESTGITKTIYTLAIMEDTEGLFGGPYFKIQKVQKDNNPSTLNSLAVYTIDIGYKTANIVTRFDIENDQSYSILYKYNEALNAYDYGKRIDDKGNLSYVYAPPLTSSNQLHLTTSADRTWWTKVTEFPIKVNLTIRGLLRPSILMSYVKLNVWFYGRKHISSGYYIITSQTDIISSGGFRTNLSLTRIAPDGDLEIATGMFGEQTPTSPSTPSSSGYSSGSSSSSSSKSSSVLNVGTSLAASAAASGIGTAGSVASNIANLRLKDVSVHQGRTGRSQTIIIRANNKTIDTTIPATTGGIAGIGGYKGTGGSSGW